MNQYITQTSNQSSKPTITHANNQTINHPRLHEHTHTRTHNTHTEHTTNTQQTHNDEQQHTHTRNTHNTNNANTFKLEKAKHDTWWNHNSNLYNYRISTDKNEFHRTTPCKFQRILKKHRRTYQKITWNHWTIWEHRWTHIHRHTEIQVQKS